MQAFIPASRSLGNDSLGEENRPIEAAGEVDPDMAGNPIMLNTEETSPMRLDWTPPMDQSGSNSVANTRPTSRNVGTDQDQDPIPLSDPLIAMVSGINTATSTTSKTPPSYFGELCDMNFPFGKLVRQDSENTDRFSTEESSETHTTGLEVPTPASSSGSLQLHDVITTQVQLLTAQVKSIDFEHFHHAWPFLHSPTFAPEKQTTLLTSALANVSMWMENANSHHLVPYQLNQELTRVLMPKITEEAFDIPLPTLQALVITLIYAILGDASTSTLNWAAQWTDIAICTLRRLGVLDDRWLPEEHIKSADERWIQTEEMKRLVYAVFRIDTYLCIILDRPPTMRYQEFGLPLPVSEAMWRAETREDRTNFHWYEPAGRTKSAFSTMVRDGLESQGFGVGYLRMPHLSLEDNHFSLCAFSSELWGVSKEAHEDHHRNYRSPELNRTSD
ncbi:hypothetical protein N7445_008274 [Penicillium cf. griseofulvum]|nr:hypothetical protein N7445_008274 [Penicillium cf. griseofulvum]